MLDNADQLHKNGTVLLSLAWAAVFLGYVMTARFATAVCCMLIKLEPHVKVIVQP